MPSLDWKTGFLKDIPISGNDLKHFISTIQGYPAGMQVSGTYRLAKEPLVSGGGLSGHFPLGIPRCTPVSVSIDRPSQNIKLTVSQLTSDGVTIWAAKESESLPLAI